jgi:hypothetical protein
MSNLIPTATRLLNKNGEPVVIQSPSQGGGIDPITGDPLPPVVGTTINTMGYLGKYQSQEIDGTNIQTNDGKLIIAATSPRVLEGWNATVDNRTYRIIKVNPVRKAGKDIILILQVRI